jgi:AcrR family transcriptional regulator
MSSSLRGPYAKTPAVRDRILTAALRLFSDAGFRGTTMKAIAEAAEISQRGLVHHFASKEDVLLALLERYDLETEQKVPESERLADVLDSLIVLASENLRQSTLIELHTILSAEATSSDHPAHEHYVARYDRAREGLRRVFDDLRASGGLATDLDSQTLAQVFIALQDGLQLQWLLNPSVGDVGEVMTRVMAQFRAER